eukprot:TRINITY_DN24783_c0_g1_i1.p1 TRINITY_DN24783_c0_g1~~TRINITY_DN24783_c0_g1_i1.p1  ORF type:complete len:777 (+),score=143.89 TRINITY_DN24783_c0_g1_i1:227-2557(+)
MRAYLRDWRNGSDLHGGLHHTRRTSARTSTCPAILSKHPVSDCRSGQCSTGDGFVIEAYRLVLRGLLDESSTLRCYSESAGGRERTTSESSLCEIREMQMKFTAPHPLNLLAPHLMIELRQVGYIEIYGPETWEASLRHSVCQDLDTWLDKNWRASRVEADPHFCDRKYRCSAFKKRGSEGENNLGLCAMKLIEHLVKTGGWKMIACNAGNFGRRGDKREQQLVLRYDGRAAQADDHLLVELRDVGYVEISGIEGFPGVTASLHDYLTVSWQCAEYKSSMLESFSAKYCDRKYRTPPLFYQRDGLRSNLGRRTVELAIFFSGLGWDLAACNGGSLVIPKQKKRTGHGIVREHQIKFTRSQTDSTSGRHLLMIEFRAVPVEDFSARASLRSSIEVNGPNVEGVHLQLTAYFERHMQCQRVPAQSAFCDLLFTCDAFQMKEASVDGKEGIFLGENNFGKHAMRLCDFLVDYLGQWDLLVCNSNCIDVPLRSGRVALAREVQMVFRHRVSGRDVFMTDSQIPTLGRAPLHPPVYWLSKSIQGSNPQEVVPASEEELVWLQELMDGTYRRVATRDRQGKPIASRFEVVQAVRSENPFLWDRYAGRRRDVAKKLMPLWKASKEEPMTPVTMGACLGLALRCLHQEYGNPANEAYLFHGSNPTAAMSILSTSFRINLAGRNAGSMFGPGIYMAESCVKADEYAQDDTDGSYAGLFAVLVCRAVLGRVLLVTDPADYGPLITSGDFESVVGDREKAAGTFREFVFFHEEAVYPEFAVFYRRIQ